MIYLINNNKKNSISNDDQPFCPQASDRDRRWCWGEGARRPFPSDLSAADVTPGDHEIKCKNDNIYKVK